MQVPPNGCGFELHSSRKGNGLANMQKRTTEINDKLKITTARSIIPALSSDKLLSVLSKAVMKSVAMLALMRSIACRCSIL